MNGIEKITARIQQDAQADRDSLLQKARDQAAAIGAEYEARAQAAADAAAEKAELAARQQRERLESAAQMEAKQLVLAAKQTCVDRAFDRALEELSALPEEAYVSLLARMAVRASQTGQEELILSPADRERVGARVVAEANRLRSATVLPFETSGQEPDSLETLVKDTLKGVGNAVATAVGQLRTGTAFTLSQETREMAGGLILKDGSVEINCAFETQLRLLRESMAAEVAGLLFS